MMFYGRLAEGSFTVCFGLAMLCLAPEGLVRGVASFGTSTIAVSSLVDISGRLAMASMGVMLIAGGLATLGSCFNTRTLFVSRQGAWQKVSWMARASFYAAAIVPIIAFAILFAWVILVYGTRAVRIEQEETLMVSTFWLQSTILLPLLGAGLCVWVMRAYCYWRVSVDQATGNVSVQRRRWPFPITTTHPGLFQKLAVMPREQLSGCDFGFFDPARGDGDGGWLVIQTAGELVPLKALLSLGELEACQKVAENWNAKLAR